MWTTRPLRMGSVSALLIVALWCVASAGAADKTWGGLATGHAGADGVSFMNPANWYEYGVPGPGHRAVFSPVPAPLVVMPTHGTNQLLVNTTAALNLGGGVYTVNAASPTPPLTVGDASGTAGALSIASGTLRTPNGPSLLGEQTGAWGEMLLTNEAEWNAADVFVGYHGHGELELNSNSKLTVESLYLSYFSSATSTMTVSGSDTEVVVNTVLEVGDGGTGRLAITNGAKVDDWTFGADNVIGDDPGSDGTILVTGSSSRMYLTDLTVGNHGRGELLASDNGFVRTHTVCIGAESGGNGLVRLSSPVDSGIQLGARGIYVGGDESAAGGSGELVLEDYANVEATFLRIRPGSRVEIGPNAQLSVSEGNPYGGFNGLSIGCSDGPGRVELAGTLEARSLTIGDGGPGTLVQTGGLCRVQSVLDVGRPGISGLYDFRGVSADFGTMRIFSGSELRIDGTGYLSGTSAEVRAGSEVNVRSGSSAGLQCDDVDNDGTITVNSDGADVETSLTLVDNTVLSGNGELVLNRAGSFAQINCGVAQTTTPWTPGPVTHGADHTIRGLGQINIVTGLINEGLVSADVSGQTLQIQEASFATGDELINSGVLQASGGWLLLDDLNITQTGAGTIRGDGSMALIRNSAVSGGTLASSAGGWVRCESVTLTDVMNLGDIEAWEGDTRIAGSFANSGTVTVDRSHDAPVLQFEPLTVLSGTGAIVLHDMDAVLRTDPGVALIHPAGHTIRGTGYTVADLDNAGLVLAGNGDDLGLGERPAANRGEFRVEGGGQMSLYDMTLTQTAGGHVLVEGGQLALYSAATIAGGTVTVRPGGAILCGWSGGALTGVELDSAGTISGTGTISGSIHNEGLISADLSGKTLTIEPTGTGLDNVGGLRATGGGTLAITDAYKLVQTGQVTVDSGSELTCLAGDYLQVTGRTHVDGTLTTPAAVLLNGGSLSGNGIVQATFVTSAGGSVEPGASIGALIISGDYEQSDFGRLEIEVAGAMAPGADYDVLDVGGLAELAGTLAIETATPHMLVDGDILNILTTVPPPIGVFDAIEGKHIGGGLFYKDVYHSAGVDLFVIQAVPGDANLDGMVNVFDLAVLGNHYGTSGREWTDADFTGEGDVDVFDLAALGNNYGVIPGGSEPVPEPATLLLLAAGAGVLSRRRRR